MGANPQPGELPGCTPWSGHHVQLAPIRSPGVGAPGLRPFWGYQIRVNPEIGSGVECYFSFCSSQRDASITASRKGAAVLYSSPPVDLNLLGPPRSRPPVPGAWRLIYFARAVSVSMTTARATLLSIIFSPPANALRVIRVWHKSNNPNALTNRAKLDKRARQEDQHGRS